MTVRAGDVFAVIDGVTYEVGDSINHNVGGVAREDIPNVSNADAFQESNFGAFLEFTYLHHPNVSEKQLAAMSDVTIILKRVVGNIAFNHARSAQPPDSDDAAGTGTIRFQCNWQNVEEFTS